MDLTRIEPNTTATRIYAVGDIHGRLDLLLSIEAQIREDLKARPTEAPLVCYLGDYVDRGPTSAGVIEYLATGARDDLMRIFLKGNHEDRLLAFLRDPVTHGPKLLSFGGREALASYGLPQDLMEAEDWHALRSAFASALPEAHVAFLNSLSLAFRWRDFLFVHAGVNPERPLNDQDAHDLMWIREPFLSSDGDYGMRVVHGHVIETVPVVRGNRIGLDTGCGFRSMSPSIPR